MNIPADLNLYNESDVEQKFIYPLLTNNVPTGLGYSNYDFRTKADIRKIKIDKGTKSSIYYPDYLIIIQGLPLLIIEAKTVGEDLEAAWKEARLYATEGSGLTALNYVYL
ncbi:type I restriction enzyme HsdR N-terminal domain-containing protein [Spirosoma sp. KNUC1025]|uniref:type I restriction enzyme HsdR N-terminal domain-containing protein n=1 Tax=Spirosoma sp. KNUC1025 TaxID=2894082 RepID=UPI00386E5011|nr:hypothetical protein LN737_04545 [Spirosoma sp. KNUC1025]